MSDEQKDQQNQAPRGREPIFMLPGVALALVGVMLAVHLAKSFVLNESGNVQLVVWFAFIPLRLLEPDSFPGGWIPLAWTPVTHAFLHADWEHLLINCTWLAVFATPVARRYGTRITLILFFASAIVGAICFAITTLPNIELLIGASGGVAGLTGAASRFIFQPLLVARDPETGATRVLGRRTATLRDLMRNQQAIFFIGIWLVLNAAVPFLPALIGQSISIAWQTHLGGFMTGLLLLPVLEPRPKLEETRNE